MLYYSRNSTRKTVHVEGCHYIKNTPQENLIQINTIGDAIRYHLPICKSCNQIVHRFHKEEELIYEFCMTNGVSVQVKPSFLMLKTPVSKWVILTLYRKGELTLFHRNTHKAEHDDMNFIQGYHLQKVSCDTIVDYLEYILDHDRFRLEHPLKMDVVTPPARKGTKRYRKEQKQAKERARRQAVKNVLSIIDSLQIRK